eukprot:SAG11_NODE_261_length_11530_cov_8.418861_15_plen_92_part_00
MSLKEGSADVSNRVNNAILGLIAGGAYAAYSCYSSARAQAQELAELQELDRTADGGSARAKSEWGLRTLMRNPPPAEYNKAVRAADAIRNG